MKRPVPILRSFDERKAKEFYCGFLGFEVNWEHRFEAGLPLYMQVTRGECVLHLSEHHGDACPGAAIRIETGELASFCAGLRAKQYGNSRPGDPQLMPWGTREITIADPFGNRLTFFEGAPAV